MSQAKECAIACLGGSFKQSNKLTRLTAVDLGGNSVLQSKACQYGYVVSVGLQWRSELAYLQEDFSQAAIGKPAGGRAVLMPLVFERKGGVAPSIGKAFAVHLPAFAAI